MHFSPQSLEVIERRSNPQFPALKLLITQVLELDPRPTSQRGRDPPLEHSSEGLRFAFRLLDFDIKWQIREREFYVDEVIEITK